jgi:GntR family galactonate operon transcriptional repressor
VTNSPDVAGLLAQGSLGVRTTVSRPRRLATPVIEDFVDQIVSGNILPGTDLPSETNICNFLGISRTVLREVLKVLEQKGLVRVENGKGTFTTERDEWKLLDPVVLAARLRHDPDRSFLNHLVKVRIALEAEMCREAATEATPEEIALMAAKIDELQGSLNDPPRYFVADEQFHDIIMRASGNQLGRAIVLTIYYEVQQRMSRDVEFAHLEESMRGHTAIYEAIKARNPVGAADAAREHIEGGWRTRTEVDPALWKI